MAKFGNIKQWLNKELVTQPDFNGVHNEIGGNPLIMHDENTGVRLDDFQLGQLGDGVGNDGQVVDFIYARDGAKVRTVGPTGLQTGEFDFPNTGAGGGAYPDYKYLGTGSDGDTDAGTIVQDSGQAQAGAASTITLAGTASATDNIYNGMWVRITIGTGLGQSALITAYNGTTKVATISGTWGTNPDNTSIYRVIDFRMSGEYHFTDFSLLNGEQITVTTNKGTLKIRVSGTLKFDSTSNILNQPTGINDLNRQVNGSGGDGSGGNAPVSGRYGFAIAGSGGGGGGTGGATGTGYNGSNGADVINTGKITVFGGALGTGTTSAPGSHGTVGNTPSSLDVAYFTSLGIYGIGSNGGGGGGISGSTFGGAGSGTGGGAVRLYCDTIDLSGTPSIDCSGTNGAAGGGTLGNSGAGGGGGGGGGSIVVSYTNIVGVIGTLSLDVTGGAAGPGNAATWSGGNGGAGGAGWAVTIVN